MKSKRKGGARPIYKGVPASFATTQETPIVPETAEEAAVRLNPTAAQRLQKQIDRFAKRT